jgi:hypothetical protein
VSRGTAPAPVTFALRLSTFALPDAQRAPAGEHQKCSPAEAQKTGSFGRFAFYLQVDAGEQI